MQQGVTESQDGELLVLMSNVGPLFAFTKSCAVAVPLTGTVKLRTWFDGTKLSVVCPTAVAEKPTADSHAHAANHFVEQTVCRIISFTPNPFPTSAPTDSQLQERY
jgi:hypothetical protein